MKFSCLPYCLPAALACLLGCGGGHFSSGNGGQAGQVALFGQGSSSSSQEVVRKGNLEFLSLRRNQEEVEALLGSPQKRGSEDGILVEWEYRRAVFDEVTGITFGWSRVTLTFDGGLCSKVTVDLQHPPPPVTAVTVAD